jgi:ubiquinone/menaquinone biosynthesis C-methylase UbiE
MHGRVCPWWVGYLLASPLRRLAHDPHTILAPFVSAGMTVLEPGPGMGFFTLELARLVGPGGRVIAVDLQPRMLAVLERRARRAGLAERIATRVAAGERLGIEDLAGAVDFVLAIAMVHELPNPGGFFAEVARALKPGARLLLSEPKVHVSGDSFAAELAAAEGAGFTVASRPEIRRSRSALLRAPRPS